MRYGMNFNTSPATVHTCVFRVSVCVFCVRLLCVYVLNVCNRVIHMMHVSAYRCKRIGHEAGFPFDLTYFEKREIILKADLVEYMSAQRCGDSSNFDGDDDDDHGARPRVRVWVWVGADRLCATCARTPSII